MTHSHPGRIRLIIGIVLLFSGAFSSAINLYVSDALFYLGVGLLIWGVVAWLRGRKAARESSTLRLRAERDRVAPVAASESQSSQDQPLSTESVVRARVAPLHSSPLTVPPRNQPDPQLTAVSDFLYHYIPSERFGREGEFEVELAQALRGRFGNPHVRRQEPVGEGRIDLQVFGIGIELKIAGSPGALVRLADQVAIYRDHYGPNLIVVILDDTGGNNQVSRLRDFLASQGVKVFLK